MMIRSMHRERFRQDRIEKEVILRIARMLVGLEPAFDFQ